MVRFIIECVINTIFWCLLILIMIIFGLKLWLEPRKGVCKCKTKLEGKVALVTGGNSGIGLETARDLARRGATVIIACRNKEKSEEAVADIVASTGNDKVEYKALDLSDLQSIKTFSEDFNKSIARLDILVNNAGVAGLKESVNRYDIDKVTQINYIGPFMLTNLLLKKLIASKPSRIVIVSSYANQFHNFDIKDLAGKKRIGTWKKYCNTKLCNIFWAKALSKRLPDGVTVNALHPGVVKTDIFNKLPETWRKFLLWVIGAVFKSPTEGAQTTIHLCVSPDLENTTGEYFSDCKLSTAAKITNDKTLVDKVWDETILLVEKANIKWIQRPRQLDLSF